MENWDDCLASLRAGVSPEKALPRIQTLFSNLPAAAPSTESAVPATPISRLYHTFSETGDHVFQLPFLRAPFSLWESLDNAEKPDECTTLFDTEMTVDILEPFQPRFVHPPEFHVRKLLEEFRISDGECGGKAVRDGEDTFKESSITMGTSTDRLNSFSHLQLVTNLLSRFLTREKTSMHTDDENELPRFPALSVDEWSVVFTKLNEDCELLPSAITKLVLIVNQPAFSMVLLQTVFPLLIAANPEPDMNAMYTDMISTAASRAELHKLPVSEVRALLDLYRGMDAGVLGALAQLKVVINLGKGN